MRKDGGIGISLSQFVNKLHRATGHNRKKKFLPISVSFHQSIHFSVCLFVSISIRITGQLSFYLSVCLSVCLSTCLFVLRFSKGASYDYPFAHEAISIVFRCILALHCAHLFACLRTPLRSFDCSLAHSLLSL